MRTLQPREHGLLILALFAAVGVGYGLGRFRPAMAAWAALRTELAATRTTLSETELPSEISADPDALAGTQEARAQALAEKEAAIRRMESRFLSLTEPGAASTLRLSVARLIENTGAKTEALKPLPPARDRPRWAEATAPEDALQDTAAGQSRPAETASSTRQQRARWLATRPKLALTLRGRYRQLEQVIDGLDALPWRVIVTEMQLTTDASNRLRPLEMRLVLAY